jgi:hypothetical protein
MTTGKVTSELLIMNKKQCQKSDSPNQLYTWNVSGLKANMGKREANYRVSDGVKAIISDTLVQEMVKTTVDKAYNRNLVIKVLFVNRFNLFAKNGRILNGGELIKALREDVNLIEQVLPIVGLYEEKGEDWVIVVLQSEVEKWPTPIPNEWAKLLKTPPNITVKQLAIEARRKG